MRSRIFEIVKEKSVRDNVYASIRVFYFTHSRSPKSVLEMLFLLLVFTLWLHKYVSCNFFRCCCFWLRFNCQWPNFSCGSIFAFVLHVKQNAFRLFGLLLQLFGLVVIYLFRSLFCWIMDAGCSNKKDRMKKSIAGATTVCWFPISICSWTKVLVVAVVGNVITGYGHRQNGKL